MKLNSNQFRVRAVRALHALVDVTGAKADCGPAIPAALELAGARLIIAAGDAEASLDPAALRPLSRRTGYDVLATWVDPMLSGHRFLIDVVLAGDPPQALAEYRLWLANTGGAFLIAGTGDGPAIAVTREGLFPATLAFANDFDRLAGIARGQARLQTAIFGGSPFQTPIDRGLAR